MIDLSGKSAVVTGGSRGIGRAIALRLAAQGADVAFSYRGNEAAAKETAAAIEALGRKALPVQGDVTEPESAEALVKAALEAFGKVDILVNNAGITRDDLIMRMSVEAFREVLETNLFGAFYATKAVTRPMLKAKGGRIVNITSVSGQAGQMGQANYSAAKAGPDRPHEGDRPRARVAWHHVQRGRAGLRPDRTHAGSARRRSRRRSPLARRLGGSGRPTRSQAPSRSLPATKPPSSPARCWPSMAAWS